MLALQAATSYEEALELFTAAEALGPAAASPSARAQLQPNAKPVVRWL
jgi:hypothetical protein